MKEPIVGEIVYQAARDTALASVGSKTTLGGMVTSIFGWLASSNSAVLIGIIVTVGGFLLNWYYQRRREIREEYQAKRIAEAFDKEEVRKEELHRLRVTALKESQGANLVQ